MKRPRRPRSWNFWTQGKLELLGDYMNAFTVACSKKAGETNYLDLYAGTPDNLRRDTGAPLAGSARRAMSTEPPFSTVVFFEQSTDAADQLQAMLDREYPHRDGRVFGGDCNTKLPTALAALARDQLDWRPTLAFLDPYATNIHWPSLARLARFRRSRRYKAELLMLLATPAIPRRRLATSFVDDTTALFGSDEWLLPLRLRQAGVITAAELRDEMANLMRWRLEEDLGYQRTHLFQVKYAGAKGVPIYDLIFATDNPAGDKIMRDLFTRSTRRFPQMAAEAQDLNMQRQQRDAGQRSLLDELSEDFQPVYKSAPAADLYRRHPPIRPLRPSDLEDLPPQLEVGETGVDPRPG